MPAFLYKITAFLLFFRYQEALVKAREYGIKKSIASGLGHGASWGIVMFTLGVGFWYGGKLVRDGDYQVHEMMAVSEVIKILTFIIST